MRMVYSFYNLKENLFLYIGITLAFYKSDGKTLVLNDKLKRDERGFESLFFNNFKIFCRDTKRSTTFMIL